MAESRFSDLEKDRVVHMYTKQKCTISYMATVMNCSTRTIGRILEERGIALPEAKKRGEGYHAALACKKHGIPVDQLDTFLMVAKKALETPTYGKVVMAIQDMNKEQLTGLLVSINRRIDELIFTPLPKVITDALSSPKA